ncbi:MAG TPA: histidine ammonia-lyase [Gammaproteobacteria bacterium]|nr:histidine ammonia-lyase [Gammaproteobacteria bacterium]
MNTFLLNAGELSLEQLEQIILHNQEIIISEETYQKIQNGFNTLQSIMATGKKIYGVNTGFGKLAQENISKEDLALLQKKLLLSHATGVGTFFHDSIVALVLLLKINSLSLGFSGIRREIIDALLVLLNNKYYPCVPSQGSVGASGDLAPLAHLSCILIGEGYVRHENKILSAKEALEEVGLKETKLAPKEGLSLINGTQVSTALGVFALLQSKKLFESALIAGSLSVDAASASDQPFESKIHRVRRLPEQIFVAKILKNLLKDSKIRENHKSCNRIQDPYSLRCQPQVMGGCLTQIRTAARILRYEINAATDNPLVFADTQEILSGGNFHAQPVAFACDNIALALAEIGSLAERRIALLLDASQTGLPSFLVENSGLNSGFMLAHVTAASLVTENKHLAHAVSIESIPTSGNQEDHVSMSTYAARRLHTMVDNLAHILSIEMLIACQGIDFRAPLQTSPALLPFYHIIRKISSFLNEDRMLSEEIQRLKNAILQGKFQTSETQIIFDYAS